VTRRRTLTALVLAGAAASAAVPAQAGVPGALRPQKRTVEVADNFYGPSRITVNPGSTVTWKWTEEAADVHDVKLTSGPKGVRRFWSEAASYGYSYRRTLKTPGTYRILCTLHEADDMRMTVVVRRPR